MNGNNNGFGFENDLYISNGGNINKKSLSDIGNSYELQDGIQSYKA